MNEKYTWNALTLKPSCSNCLFLDKHASGEYNDCLMYPSVVFGIDTYKKTNCALRSNHYWKLKDNL